MAVERYGVYEKNATEVLAEIGGPGHLRDEMIEKMNKQVEKITELYHVECEVKKMEGKKTGLSLNIRKGQTLDIVKNDKDRISKVKIEEVLSEEKSLYTSVFHYRLGKELEVALNEDGSPTVAYSKMILEHRNPIEYEKFHKFFCLREIAQSGELDPQYIYPISAEEYKAEMAGQCHLK
jgi:hypothetical protein